MASIKHYILILFLWSIGVSAQSQMVRDSIIATEYRSLNSTSLQQLQMDEELHYEFSETSNSESWWTRLKLWWANLLLRIFGGIASPQFIQLALLILGVGLIIFAIVRMVMADGSSLFKRTSNARSFHISEDNLHEVSLEEELEKARQEGQWRLYVRLTYLFVLKRMSAARLIELKKGKTNHEYYYEIENAAILHSFKELSRIFEYTWYGGFEANPQIAEKCDRESSKLQSLI